LSILGGNAGLKGLLHPAEFLAGAEYSNGLLHLPVDNGFRGLPKDCAGSFHSAETLNVLWIASKIESYG
jgi:hypothetical protein